MANSLVRSGRSVIFRKCAVALLASAAAPMLALTTSQVSTESSPFVGPQRTITCPAGAVDVPPGSSIQRVVDMRPGATTFCLRAGVHPLENSITPKTGNVFVGEYGAILDGTGWTTRDDTQAAFRAHTQDIDNVTIRNLVIRHMPQRGIHAYYDMADHWTIEYNEIAFNTTAIVFPPSSIIRNNYIHHNTYSGYMGASAHYSTVESNEIAYNGPEQKVGASAHVTVRNNFVHHNAGVGIWYDYDNTDALVEGNRVEDNGHIGIFYEVSTDGIIRNNTIRRNGDAGVFLGTSKNAQIYNNTIENNFRGITYFLDCPSVGGGSIRFDLMNNTAHDNTITISTRSGALASGFSYAATCTTAQVAPYLNGSKNLTFSRNTYHVPSLTGRYWFWAVTRYWDAWRALRQDADSVIVP
jgi:parallel beta-helix repeat protein